MDNHIPQVGSVSFVKKKWGTCGRSRQILQNPKRSRKLSNKIHRQQYNFAKN